MNYETAAEIEIAVSKWLGRRRNLIVPNISWGIGLHECDLIYVTASSYMHEIEIKISKRDLLKDDKKWHKHKDRQNRIRSLSFAIPRKLDSCADLIRTDAGIIVVDRDGTCTCVRTAKTNESRRLRDDEMYAIARLGALRTWPLRENILGYRLHIEFLKKEMSDLKNKIKTFEGVGDVRETSRKPENVS